MVLFLFSWNIFRQCQWYQVQNNDQAGVSACPEDQLKLFQAGLAAPKLSMLVQLHNLSGCKQTPTGSSSVTAQLSVPRVPLHFQYKYFLPVLISKSLQFHFDSLKVEVTISWELLQVLTNSMHEWLDYGIACLFSHEGVQPAYLLGDCMDNWGFSQLFTG